MNQRPTFTYSWGKILTYGRINLTLTCITYLDMIFPLSSAPLPSAQLDSRSFFFDIAPGADSGATGIIALLAAAHALRNATQEAQPNRTILYTFFQGVGCADAVVPIIVSDVCSNLFSISAHVFKFFDPRKPLTTLAARGWCMICRTISLLWT